MAERPNVWHRLLRLLEWVHLGDWIAHGSIWAKIGGGIVSAAVMIWGIVQGSSWWTTGAAIFLVLFILMLAASAAIAFDQRRRLTKALAVAKAEVEVAKDDLSRDSEATIATALQVEGFIDNLFYAYPMELWRENPNLQARLVMHGRSFSCLRVRNVGDANLYKLKARCLISDSEKPCHWSQTVDGRFVLGGGPSADISVEHDGLLVVAQGLARMRQWTTLPHDQSRLFLLNLPSESAKGLKAQVLGWKPAVEALEADGSGELVLTVQFHAEGLHQVERFRLGFDDSLTGCTITKLSEDRPPSKASGQSPPSSPGSSE